MSRNPRRPALAASGPEASPGASGATPRDEPGRVPALRIRLARAEDVRAIGALLAAFAPGGLVRERSEEELRRELGTFQVAAAGSAVVGCVALRGHSPVLAELASLAVAEGWHNRGIGGRLVEAAVLRAHAGGARRVFAFTQRQRLFERLGFRVTPVSDFPAKLAIDYGGVPLVGAGKCAVVRELEGPPTPDAYLAGGLPDGIAPAAPPGGARPSSPDEIHPRFSRRSDVTAADAQNRAPIAILGGGNLGRSLAMGWVQAGHYEPFSVWITRRSADKLASFADAGFRVTSDNLAAVRAADILLLAVQPQQIEELLEQIRPGIDPERHRIVSVVSGVTIGQIRERLDTTAAIVRAMPNTAVAIGESMTCLSSQKPGISALAEARELFDLVGRTLIIPEEMMIPATALCACGVAFFLRAIRAASQGGIEIGFPPDEALLLAAQTAKGAASLLLTQGRHPESEIDRVTTPRGCTIAGLNEMEHQGFSSAMIKGILLSATTAEGLYRSA
jgi:pyrroline-5-carboxylate reductase